MTMIRAMTSNWIANNPTGNPTAIADLIPDPVRTAIKIPTFVALDDEERRDLQILEQKNVPLVIQYVPTDPEEPFKA
ncbi:hypothetical protein WP50_10215 [Lactiplantibacillus plantarum]|nr:hypothetical protein WP50_10215 [Lactiplantibacillus plantarum]